jgi:hypothetical protein
LEGDGLHGSIVPQRHGPQKSMVSPISEHLTAVRGLAKLLVFGQHIPFVIDALKPPGRDWGSVEKDNSQSERQVNHGFWSGFVAGVSCRFSR